MTTLQLTDLPIQVFVFAGILAVLLVSFLLVFVLRGVILRAKLSRLVKQIRSVGAEKGDPASLFETDQTLKHLWQEFRKTLHEQKELDTNTGQMRVVALRPTVPAEMFFNTQALVDNPLRIEFFRHLPGIFTGVGIIGTFMGLIIGLQAFQVSETPTVVRQSLNSLLHGVWEAFLVSALAISLAMIVTVIEKLLLASLYRKVEELNQALDSQLVRAFVLPMAPARIARSGSFATSATSAVQLVLKAAPVTHRPIRACQRGAARIGPWITGNIAALMDADVPLSGSESFWLSIGFRGLIEAPIRSHKGRVAWKDVGVFHYQPRGDEHGAEYPAGACISPTQAGRDAHRAFAQHDLSIHQGRRFPEAGAARAARGRVDRVG